MHGPLVGNVTASLLLAAAFACVTFKWEQGCTDQATVSGDRLSFRDCDAGLLLVLKR